jgi:hypothetical protein
MPGECLFLIMVARRCSSVTIHLKMLKCFYCNCPYEHWTRQGGEICHYFLAILLGWDLDAQQGLGLFKLTMKSNVVQG